MTELGDLTLAVEDESGKSKVVYGAVRSPKTKMLLVLEGSDGSFLVLEYDFHLIK